MRRILAVAAASALALTLACGSKDVFCHGPGCAAVCAGGQCAPESGVIYRSVGAGSTSALAAGDAGAVRIAAGVATFERALPDRVGVGDALVLTAQPAAIVFLARRHGPGEFAVQTADGGLPPDRGATTSWALYRAYTSLADAAERTPNPGIPAALAGFDGTAAVKDLVAAQKIWAIACYADAPDSADARDAWFDDAWRTDRDHFLRVFTPATPAEAGARQRHEGRYDPSRYVLRKSANRDTGGGGVILVGTAFARLEGLQVVDLATSSADTLVHASAVEGGELRVSSTLLLASAANVRGTVGLEVYGSPAYRVLAWNDVFAGFTRAGVFSNTGDGTGVELLLAANTFHGCQLGIESPHGRAVAVNDLFAGVPSGGRCVSATTPLDPASDHDVCSLTETPTGAHSVSGAEARFVDAAAWDFHLAASDTAAAARGADLSRDPALAFDVDLDGVVRSGAWDVGADQR